jgi:hypothetical protein
MIDHIKATVTKAEGFLDLGMAEEAWGILDDLPSESMNHPQVLSLRIQILAHEREWLKLSLLAEGVLAAFPALSGVWYDLAKARVHLGELEAARVALKRACELDEGLRLKALDELDLDGIW